MVEKGSPVVDTPNSKRIEQMFLGTFDRSIDDKGRLILPASFREALGENEAVVTRGLDRCVVLMPSDHFQRWQEKIESLPMTSGQARNLKRHVYSGAAPANPDGQGRISIPPFLRVYANLQGAVMVCGVGSYAEIWNVQQWADLRERIETSGDDEAAWDALGI